MSEAYDQQRFTFSEVAAEWHGEPRNRLVKVFVKL